MLLRMWKPHRGKRGAPKAVKTGIGGHPHAAFPVHDYLPDGIGAQPLHQREAFPGSRFHRQRRWPSLHMVKPPDTLAGDHPQRTIRGEGEVAKLSIPLITISRWRGISRGRGS